MNDERSVKIQEATPKTTAEKLNIHTDVARLVITRFLHNEITKAGFSRAVLGLSGGIDSALSCYLVAEALGPENVLALRLPYATSSSESLEHAGLIIEALGIAAETIDITAMVDGLVAVTPDMTAHRKGNVMARARMIAIYDRSYAWNGLVVGTSNKTELLLGYGTIFGDLASAVNPIGDLYKTQVRQLSRAMGIPAAIIDKAPSADLMPGQTDEGDLGFTYEAVDQLLYLLVDERYSRDELLAKGYEPGFVDRVWQLIRRNQYKRALPVIPKISDRSVGHDFRYLRDWGT
jgi:NAD+ synthase